ncbi:SDR family oxidoreductase [Candidatus Sumerlaeota bacterium]|nr:SDR family oxidoreductase [Candidatus Sumerlaeota bacterium]
MIFLTGASGFVGEHFARLFAAAGEQVVGTYLSHPISIPRVDCVPAELTDGRAVRRLLEAVQPTAIVHCAAATKTGWCEDHPAEARAAIVEATANLCDAARAVGQSIPLVLLSTDLVFDGENAPYGVAATPKPLNLYGSLKLEAENFVKNLPSGIVMRTALVYGPPATHGASFLQWIVKGLVLREPVTLFEDEWRTPISVFDLFSAVRTALAAWPNGRRLYHAGGDDRLSRHAMGRVICDVAGLPRDSIVSANRSDVPGGAMRARDVSLSCGELHELGWHPQTFELGLWQCLQQGTTS